MGIAVLGYECPKCGAQPHKQCNILPGDKYRSCHAGRWHGRPCNCERCLTAPFRPFNVCKPLVWEREVLELLSGMTDEQRAEWTRNFNRARIDGWRL